MNGFPIEIYANIIRVNVDYSKPLYLTSKVFNNLFNDRYMLDILTKHYNICKVNCFKEFVIEYEYDKNIKIIQKLRKKITINLLFIPIFVSIAKPLDAKIPPYFYVSQHKTMIDAEFSHNKGMHIKFEVYDFDRLLYIIQKITKTVDQKFNIDNLTADHKTFIYNIAPEKKFML